jgi:hypothetical protein
MFPETCGKTLEEVDALFEDGVPAWKSDKTVSRMDERVHEIEAKGEAGVMQTERVNEKSEA